MTCKTPGGAFYAWPNVTEACRMIGAADSEEFRKRLLNEGGVAVLADIHFGARVPGEGQHVRFSYAASRQAIEQGRRPHGRFHPAIVCGDPRAGRALRALLPVARGPARAFYAFLLAFMGAMLGIVLSDNLILLVVFWELTSLFSFLLIGYWHHDSGGAARARAWRSSSPGRAGSACSRACCCSGISSAATTSTPCLPPGRPSRAHPLYLPALVLVLLGAFTKSAQFPFHFWLPHAMAAPTPVSAYLHSATMVKAGVFLLAASGRRSPAPRVVLDGRARRA